jgi:poly-gamma-glutamate biosynthesis protein PgsC/CapC
LVFEAIALGLLISLFFSETIGLTAGGMVVPGYIALVLHQPFRVLSTLLAALATFLVVKILSHFMFVYGRRLLVLTIVVGFTIGWLSRDRFLVARAGYLIEVQTIGYIIPGLIAYWMERQGVVKTITMMIIGAVLVRLILVALRGGTLFT